MNAPFAWRIGPALPLLRVGRLPSGSRFFCGFPRRNTHLRLCGVPTEFRRFSPRGIFWVSVPAEFFRRTLGAVTQGVATAEAPVVLATRGANHPRSGRRAG